MADNEPESLRLARIRALAAITEVETWERYHARVTNRASSLGVRNADIAVDIARRAAWRRLVIATKDLVRATEDVPDGYDGAS